MDDFIKVETDKVTMTISNAMTIKELNLQTRSGDQLDLVIQWVPQSKELEINGTAISPFMAKMLIEFLQQTE